MSAGTGNIRFSVLCVVTFDLARLFGSFPCQPGSDFQRESFHSNAGIFHVVFVRPPSAVACLFSWFLVP